MVTLPTSGYRQIVVQFFKRGLAENGNKCASAPASLNPVDRWRLNSTDSLDDNGKNPSTKPWALPSVLLTWRGAHHNTCVWNITWHCVQSAGRKPAASNVKVQVNTCALSSCYVASVRIPLFAISTRSRQPPSGPEESASREQDVLEQSQNAALILRLSLSWSSTDTPTIC